MRLSLRRVLTLMSLGLATLTLNPALAHVRITTDINWGSDVRPILRKHCMGCHHAGGIAPDYVDLTTYGTDRQPGARAWGTAIEEEILTGRMPPWQADTRFGSFRNSRVLTPEETEILVAWIRGGGPQGPRRDLPPPPEYAAHDWILGEPDLVVSPPQEHVLESGRSSGSASFKIPVEIDEDAWITGFEFLPGRPDTVYRMEAFLHDPPDLGPQTIEVEVQKEYDPFADEDELEEVRPRTLPVGTHYLGQWVRGDEPALLPDEAGRLLRRGTTVELVVNYRRPEFADPGEEIGDLSRLGLFLATEEVDLLVESKKIPAQEVVIKPGKSAAAEASLVLDENVHLIGFNPNLGSSCKSLEVRGVYPDGKSTTLLWIPQYDPKWASSYVFETPVAAPAGTRIEMTGVFENLREKKDRTKMRVGEGPGREPFVAFVDYMLDDHLQVEEPEPERAPTPASGGGMLAVGDLVDETGGTEGGGDRVADFLAGQQRVSGAEVYWCPMRGNPCAIHDFHEPGKCPECGMNLRPKAAFFKGKEVASVSYDWALNDLGRGQVYWCPNRGQDNHQLVDYPAPGTCPICGEGLLHRSRFEFVATYRCVTPECPLQAKGQNFYSDGLCPHCGQPVQSLGHMDHSPLHGSDQFFMADNLYHHLEGTLPTQGEFRLYIYDDFKKPVDPRNFAGKLVFERLDSKSGEYSETEYPLTYPRPGEEYLIGEIPQELPAEFYALVWLGGEEKRYDFYFEELTREPPPGVAGALGSNVRLHSHERLPPEIPARAVDVVREILKRGSILQALVDAEDWFSLHNPAFDAKDLAEELTGKLDGLSARQRGQVKRAVSRTLQGALDLDRAGDASDEPRVRRALERFQEGTAALLEVFPQAAGSG